MRAERTGQTFEDQIDVRIRGDGFTSCGKDLYRLYVLGLLPPGKYYTRHADVGLAAVGGKTHRQVDILLINSTVEPHFIHCFEDKWQQSGGSAERKTDSTVNDAEATYRHSGYETTIIYGGPGWNPDRITYLKKQVKTRKGLHAVCNLEEFIAIVNAGGLNGGGIATNIAPEQSEYRAVSLWKDA